MMKGNTKWDIAMAKAKENDKNFVISYVEEGNPLAVQIHECQVHHDLHNRYCPDDTFDSVASKISLAMH